MVGARTGTGPTSNLKGGRVSFGKESIGCQWDREPPVQRHSTKESPVFQGNWGVERDRGD